MDISKLSSTCREFETVSFIRPIHFFHYQNMFDEKIPILVKFNRIFEKWGNDIIHSIASLMIFNPLAQTTKATLRACFLTSGSILEIPAKLLMLSTSV